MNYQIGVCDDDKCFLDAISTSLHRYEQLKSLTFQITTYTDGEALLADYRTHHFNLMILDMEMPGKSGLEVAQEIRTFDKDVIILYSTIHKDFSLQAFDVDAISYLVKPFTDKKLFAKLDRVFKQLYLQASFDSFKNTYISIISKKMKVNLSYAEILYVSKSRNTLTVHTERETHITYMNIKDIRKQLDSSIFVKINPGQIVNWTKVTHLDDNAIHLEDVELAVSRKFSTLLNTRYRQEAKNIARQRADDFC